MTDNVRSNRDLILDEWPKKIDDVSELPLSMQDAAKSFLASSKSKPAILYIPKQSQLESSLPTGVVYDEDSLLFMTLENDEAFSTTIPFQEIAALAWKRILLDNTFTFYYPVEGIYLSETIYFNRAREAYFLPILNRVFGKPMGFDCVEAEKAHPIPLTIKSQSMALYNYLFDGYRLGNPSENISIFSMRQHASSKSKRTGQGLIAPFEDGTFTEEFYPDNQEILCTYYKKDTLEYASNDQQHRFCLKNDLQPIQIFQKQ